MINKPILFSVIYWALSLIYISIGFYSLMLDYKKNINRIFFLMCVSLSIWTISFSLMLVSKSPNLAIIHHKLAVLGWGTFYSIIVHCFFIINNPNKKLKLKSYILIYAPAIITIVLNYLPIYAPEEHYMVLSEIGYINVDRRALFIGYSNVYTQLFSLIAIYQIYKWQFKDKNNNNNKSIRPIKIIFFGVVALYMLGSYNNFIVNGFFYYEGVSLVSLFIIFPISIMFYILIKNKVMHPQNDFDKDFIISHDNLRNIFIFGGYAYLILAYSSLIFDYIGVPEGRTHQVLFSIICIIIATIHFFLADFTKNIKIQYITITFISVIVMLILSFRYLNSGGVTIWAIAFYYIIIMAIFDNTKYVYFLSSSIIAIQILQWIYKSKYVVNLYWADFIGRIFIILMAMFIIIYVNKLYQNKIKESRKRIKIQKLIADVSSKILDISIEEINPKINDLLATVCIAFECHKAYIIKSNKDGNHILLYCKNCIMFDEDGNKIIKTITDYNIVSYEELSTKKIVCKNVYNCNICDEAKDYFSSNEITGFYSLPIIVDNSTKAAITFEFKDSKVLNTLEEYSNIISNLSAIAMKKFMREETLYTNANYDEMTNLKNRNSFTKEINQIIKENKDNGHSIICLDIDNFKEINYAFGHEMGDTLLKTVSDILNKTIGEKYSIARFGADEFIIHLHDCYEKEEIIRKVESLFKNFNDPIEIDLYKYQVNISAGISRYPDDGANFNELFKNANLALHKAKIDGKMNYSFSTEEDRNTAYQRAIYTSKLVNCIENNEISLVYQPQYSIKTNKLVGAEALVRWHSKDFGNISPSEFIPILEDTAMIIDIGEWIIEEAAKQKVKLDKKGLNDIRISVNISAVQFRDKNLIETIKNILRKYQIKYEKFEFEITESAALSDDDSALVDFNNLKSTGCSLALDDFGVDFSSLNRLEKLPIDRLKIDKEFIDGIGISNKKEEITKIIINLAKTLELISIAEGVETEEQVKFLKENGCDEIQGYYYSKPLFQDDFEKFVKENL